MHSEIGHKTCLSFFLFFALFGLLDHVLDLSILVFFENLNSFSVQFSRFAQLHQSQSYENVEEYELEYKRKDHLKHDLSEGRHVCLQLAQVLLDPKRRQVALKEEASAEEHQVADQTMQHMAHAIEVPADLIHAQEGQQEHHEDRDREQKERLSVEVGLEELRQIAEDRR